MSKSSKKREMLFLSIRLDFFYVFQMIKIQSKRVSCLTVPFLSLVITFMLSSLLMLSTYTAKATEYADIGVPVARVFKSEEHLGGTQLWTIKQAKNGLVYSGGNSGIVEWDGERWQQYRTPNNTRVRSISVSSDGRLYVGTTNDIGFFASNDIGILEFHSLIVDWSFEQRQFGEIWATATNELGTVFVSEHAIYFWDGTSVKIVLEDKQKRLGINSVFATDNGFIYKRRLDSSVYKILLDPSVSGFNPQVTILSLTLPANTTLRKIIVSRSNTLVAFTSWHGIFEEKDGEFVNRNGPEIFGDDSYLRDGIQAQDGYYYVITAQHGLFILNEKFEMQRHYTEEHNTETEALYSVMEDNQNNIWLSGRVNIVKFVPPHVFSTYALETNSTGTENIGLVRGTPTIAGYGLLSLKHADEPFSPASFKNLNTNSNFNFHFIEYKNHLIYSERPGIYAIKLAENSEMLSENISEVKTIGAPFKIVEDVEAKMFAIDPISNMLFVSTFEPGLYRISLIDGQWQSAIIEGTNDYLDRLEIDDSGVIWVGTPTQELYRIENAQYDGKPTNVQKFIELPPNNVFPFKLNTGIVFGTDNGWMEYDAQREPQIDSVDYLPEKFSQLGSPLYRLMEDEQHRIWYQVGNSKGFMKQQPDGSWLTNENIFKPMPNVSTSGFARTGDNIVWYALSTGPVYRIDFKRMGQLPSVAHLHIRHIIDLNTDEEIYGGLGLLTFADLDQQSNSIRIHYALSDNSIDNATVYRHRLLGSQNERWSRWSTENQKDLTELRGASYQFELEAKDGWGRVVSKIFPFTVLPPWYLSKTAWTLYILIALSLLFLSGWLTQRWRTRKLQQQNVALEHLVAERTREVSAKVNELKEQQELKDRFFSNVSHEFRTPLTLTIGPLETVLSEHSEQINEQVTSLTTTALNNANKMLALVGQVLDINRLEAGKLPLRVSQYDLAELLRILQQRFQSWAEQEKQSITCEHCEEPLLLYFDQDKIDKCIANLLSNAIKYSGKNSQITLKIVNQSNSIVVQVIDNGHGIGEHAKTKVFERYYQDKNSEQNTTPGTGIGLSLVKELIELHHGDVSLQTKIGNGCCFSLSLKKGKQHFSEDQLVEPLELANVQSVPVNTLIKINNDKQRDQTTLLVVDDNAELRHFISLRLSASYRILQAQDGEEGFHMACKALPDLIISDVSMPKMTGYELTKKLKNTATTRSIPVILLTAKASKRDTVEGFASGADDYLSKPFDTSELIMRVNSLINGRKMIRGSIALEKSTALLNIKQASLFSEELVQHIETNISQPEFSIDKLAVLMHMSRETLGRKCKKELSVTPLAFITKIRMHHASTLLTEGTLSVSEIAYALGFESLAYFSRSFKKHTGKSPSESIKSP